ncbi:MAG: preprotein translocase subunit YajC [Actinomycetota bacterium]
MDALPNLIFLGFLIALFYFMLIRPQKRRVQAHRELLESTSAGDEIVTIGGLHGRILRIGEDDVEVEIAPGTVVRIVKTAIARRVTEHDDADAGTTETSEGGEEERA